MRREDDVDPSWKNPDALSKFAFFYEDDQEVNKAESYNAVCAHPGEAIRYGHEFYPESQRQNAIAAIESLASRFPQSRVQRMMIGNSDCKQAHLPRRRRRQDKH